MIPCDIGMNLDIGIPVSIFGPTSDRKQPEAEGLKSRL